MATRTKTTSKGSSASLLGGISKRGATKSKSTTPQINVSDETQLSAIADILDAKTNVKQAESVLKIAEGAFRDEATELFEARCRADATLHTSVRLMGTQSPGEEGARPLSLQYIQTRRCKKMQEDEAADALNAAFGDDYGDLFEAQRIVEIDTSVLTDKQVEALVKAIQKALDKSFDSAVSVQALIVPKEAFFGKRILDAAIRAKADNAVADGFAVPFASSFKA